MRPLKTGAMSIQFLARAPWWLLAVLLAAGCGLKTPPRPAEEVIPPVEGLQGRARPEGVLLSWPSPGGGLRARFGPLTGYRLRIGFQPAYCAPCPPERTIRVALPEGDPALRIEEGRAYHLHREPGEQSLWRVTVTAAYAAGDAGESAAIVVERRAALPAAELAWSWVDARHRPLSVASRASGSLPADAMIRFTWEPPQEGYRQVHGAKGTVTETVRYFRGNIYRRLPEGEWSYLPLNPKPLEGGRYELPSAVLVEGSAYRLRLVDRNGGEGAPSPEVTPLRVRKRP